MFLHVTLPKKADIFIQSKYKNYHKNYYKPFKTKRIYGIIITGIIIFFGTLAFFLPEKHINKMLASPTMNQADTMNTSANNSINTGITNNGSPSAIISPFPSIDFTNTTASSSPVPNISPAPSISPIPQPNGQDIANASAQIISVQQQIASQMQTCVTNAVQMANQIGTLTSQVQPLQTQINATITAMQNIDATTPSGAAQQTALDQQRQQLQQQLDTLNNNIQTAQNNFNTTNNQCESTVSSLEQQRDTLEGNLDTTFSNAMNIQVPQ